MKRIEVIISPERLENVRNALKRIGCSGMMITEIEGHGRQKGLIQQWRGEKYRIELLPKIKIEIIVKDSEVEEVVNTIIEATRTGEIGDGKIFISSVEEAIRIRTLERGEKAL